MRTLVRAGGDPASRNARHTALSEERPPVVATPRSWTEETAYGKLVKPTMLGGLGSALA
jgi:hypothetical protein